MSRRCAPQARPDGEMRGIPRISRRAPTIASGRDPRYEPRHRLTAILYLDEVGGLSSNPIGFMESVD
jgi:hypothetical protein